MSVLDFLQLGSALALRAYGRLGASVSVLDFLHLGSSLSLRGVGRFGSCISVADRIALGASNTYIYYSDANDIVDFYVQGSRGMSIMKESGTAGGSLHGIWYADHIVHTSDRRLKKNIKPLMDSLDTRAAEAGATEDSARWVLRELRPVSYQFKRGPESKLQRFGFIADEVQMTIPQVVREHDTPARIKGIMYEDLLSVLTAALQSMQRQLEGADAVAQGTRQQQLALEARLQRLEQAVAMHTESVAFRLAAIEALIERRLPDPGGSSRLRKTWQEDEALGFGGAVGWDRQPRGWTAVGDVKPRHEVLV